MTENGDLAKKIGSAIGVPLKAAGFRKRANSFNRVAGDGIIHVVSMQLGAFDPSGAHADFPTYRHGRFTINVGVYVPSMTRRGAPRSAWISEYHCQLRWRLGELISGEDVWWDLRDPHAAEVVSDNLIEKGIPKLDEFGDSESVLDFYFTAEPRSLLRAMTGEAALDVADLLLSRGDRDRAEGVLRHYVRQAAVDANAGHKEHVREFLGARGFEGLGEALV